MMELELTLIYMWLLLNKHWLLILSRCQINLGYLRLTLILNQRSCWLELRLG